MAKKKETLQSVRDAIEMEGFDYCFMGYSHWDGVNDHEFQRLKHNYTQSHIELEEYINLRTNDPEY